MVWLSTPYYTVYDDDLVLWYSFYHFLYCVFFFPEGGGFFLESPNFEAANPLKTPAHIAPVWYLSYTFFMRCYVQPVYVCLALPGVIVMAASMLFYLYCLVEQIACAFNVYKRYGFSSKLHLLSFVVSFFDLRLLRVIPSSDTATLVAICICTILYFLFFLLMPIYTSIETLQTATWTCNWGH